MINGDPSVLRQTGAYLQPAPGEPQNNVLKMARSGLLGALRAVIARAKKDLSPAREDGVEVGAAGSKTICNVVVMPFTGLPDLKEQLYVVLFEDASPRSGKESKAAKRVAESAKAKKEGRQLPKVEHELTATKEYLQSILEDHTRATDELAPPTRS